MVHLMCIKKSIAVISKCTVCYKGYHKTALGQSQGQRLGHSLLPATERWGHDDLQQTCILPLKNQLFV